MTTADDTLDWYTERFRREHKDACEEYLRLCSLFREVCWYNFETKCAKWARPWRGSDPCSRVYLHTMQFHRKWNRGRLVEHGCFPMWYDGCLKDAPSLPPQIIQKELQDAKDYMIACETQMTAPYDWAPDGHLYNMLRRSTTVGQPTSQCVYTPQKRKFSSSLV